MTTTEPEGAAGSGSQAGDAGRGDVGAPDVRAEPSCSDRALDIDVPDGAPGADDVADVVVDRVVGEGDCAADDPLPRPG